MQLDRIRSHTGLPVLEVEEGDADDARLRGEPQLHPCLAHLPAPIGRHPARTRRRGRLRDHVVGARLEDEVEILVASCLTSVTAASTLKMYRSKGSLVAGSGVGRPCVTDCAIGIGMDAEQAGTARSAGPAFAAARPAESAAVNGSRKPSLCALVVRVRVLCAIAAADFFPVVRAVAARTGGQRLDRLHLDFVAAVRATVGACGDVAPDWRWISHVRNSFLVGRSAERQLRCIT
jgi:hypothetical protein